MTTGLSLGPANNFFMFYELKWLEPCPSKFKPISYRRYAGESFLLFKSAEHLSKFHVYLNTYHSNMYFSFGQDKTVSCNF